MGEVPEFVHPKSTMRSDPDDHVRVVIADVTESAKKLEHTRVALANTRLAAVGRPPGLLDLGVGYRFVTVFTFIVALNV